MLILGKWILCKDKLPPINTFVLIFTGESQFPYEVMKYYGKRTRTQYDSINEWEEEYDYWSDNHGEIRDSNPVAWQFIDNFMKEGEIWVQGRVI
jgi:hypothetical protein